MGARSLRVPWSCLARLNRRRRNDGWTCPRGGVVVDQPQLQNWACLQAVFNSFGSLNVSRYRALADHASPIERRRTQVLGASQMSVAMIGGGLECASSGHRVHVDKRTWAKRIRAPGKTCDTAAYRVAGGHAMEGYESLIGQKRSGHRTCGGIRRHFRADGCF